MEAMDLVVAKKKRSDSGSSSQDQDQVQVDQDLDSRDDISLKRSVMIGKSKMETNEDEDEDLKPSSSTHKALSTVNKKNDELLESVKAEIGEVIEENQRLRSHLGRLMEDYQALQSRFHEITASQDEQEQRQQQQQQNTTSVAQQLKEEGNDQLSLSLGRNSSIDSKNKDDDNNKKISGLALALYSKHDQDQGGVLPNLSTDNGFDGPKEDDTYRETWPPKVIPATRNGGGGGGDDEAVQQPPVKRARVSVRARCDTPTMNDGCQWRKYGQKIAKGNPCPRAYYRCTVAPSCPVRKQVQRCVDDMSILITTYEGAHNHPLPISANAMATTTSAAAYMLTSGSSTSTNALGPGYYSTTTNSMITDLSSTLKFITDATRSRPPFLSSNVNSFSTYPTLQPTITLDLTAASSTPSTSTSDPFSRLASTNSTTFAPRSSYSSNPTITNLTFNSSDMASNSNPNPNCSTLNYTNTTQVGPPPLMTIGARPGPSHQDNLFYQALLQKMRNPSPNPNPTPSHGNCQPPQPPPDSTVVAAARAITSDPSFQSVLTAALSSLITGNSSSGSGGDSSSSHTQKQLQK